MRVNGFEWRDQKVLVTRASGFKGAWLCAALLELGARVYGTVRKQVHPASAYRIFGLDDRVVALNADISDRQEVYDLVNSIEPDVIFHLAAKALVPVGLRDPGRTFDVNLMGTLNVIEACRRIKVCNRILICSTDHVFGNINAPDEFPAGGFVEASRVGYGGPYDTSKAAMELLVRSYHYTYWNEVPALGLSRCANVFGFGDTNLRRVIPLFVSTAKSNQVIPLKYRNNGRQFIYVTDAIAGYVKAVASMDEGGCRTKGSLSRPEERRPFTPTFHFAIEDYTNGEPVIAAAPRAAALSGASGRIRPPYITMAALAELVAGIFGAAVDESSCVDYALNENRVQVLNCEATRRMLAWCARNSLADGLQKLGHWYDQCGNQPAQRRMAETEVQALVSSIADSQAGAATGRS